MYKYSKILSLVAAIGWIIFIFSAFKGYHFWYAGFVFFFWLSLGALNYRHETTFWYFKNKLGVFLRFYTILFVVGFISDYVIGQKMTDLWVYPYYTSLFDWVRLYAIIYPFGGLAVLELVFLLAVIFGEKIVFTKKLARLDHLVDWYLVIILAASLLLFLSSATLPAQAFFAALYAIWVLTATISLGRHLSHGIHWIAVLIGTTLMSVLLHEIPNTAVFEWKYQNMPFLAQPIFEVPIFIILGWYVLVLVMFRLWIRCVWNRK